MANGKQTRAAFANYIILGVMLAAAAAILLADQYWHSQEAFLAAYAVLWFSIISGTVVIVTGKYRKNRKPEYLRNVLVGLSGLLVTVLIFACLSTVTSGISMGLEFVAVAGATVAGMVAIKFNAMLIDEYERGKAEATQVVPAHSA